MFLKGFKKNYNHTVYASYIGYITQAIINNFAPLLFLTFQNSFHIPLNQIALLVTVNFGVQLGIDLLAAKYVDKIGYRVSIIGAHLFSAAGLLGLSMFPYIFPTPYAGLLTAVVLYAVGGGLIEVLISPIVEACPTEKKEAAMSLLHSFYCWGCVFVILGSTAFFYIAGISNWPILACVWAIVPIFNALYFSQVPLKVLVEEEHRFSIKDLVTHKIFWVLCLLMICAGASELSMSQWASAFAEAGLQVSKTIGDLAGPCSFSVFMGLARVFYAKFSEKINLQNFMILSACLCIISYLLASLSQNPILGLLGCSLCGLSVGILWPGTFSMAARKIPRGGTAMFAFLALAGDLGCTSGPTVVGMVSQVMGENLKAGLLSAIVFPCLLLVGIFLSRKIKQED